MRSLKLGLTQLSWMTGNPINLPKCLTDHRKAKNYLFVISNYWMTFLWYSRIIKAEVGVINRSRRQRFITLTETLIIPDIRKPNLIIVLLYIERILLVSRFDTKCFQSLCQLFLFLRLSQSLPSTIFSMSCSVNEANLEVMFLLLHWRQATQSARSRHNYPQKSDTAIIHNMITRDLECPWHDYRRICSPGGTRHMNEVGMLVVSLRGVNFGFWSHLGCSGQNAIIFSSEGLV